MKFPIVKLILFIFVCKFANGKFVGPTRYEKSLVIVFDTTYSMHDELEQVKSAARKIAEKYASSPNYAIYNYIFVPFNDPYVPGGEIVTTNSSLFIKTLDNVEINGGGDCPEMALTGLEVALKLTLPRSNIYIFTDATAKDYDLGDIIVKKIEQKQPRVSKFLYISRSIKVSKLFSHKYFS